MRVGGGAKARDTFIHLLMRSANAYCVSGTAPGAGPTAVTPTEIFTEMLSSWGREAVCTGAQGNL